MTSTIRNTFNLAKVVGMLLAGTFVIVVAAELVNGAARPALPSNSAAGPVLPAIPGFRSSGTDGRKASVPAQSRPEVVATATPQSSPVSPMATSLPYPLSTPSTGIAPVPPQRAAATPMPTVSTTPRPQLNLPTPGLGLSGSKLLAYSCLWPIIGSEPLFLTVNFPVPTSHDGIYVVGPIVVSGQFSADVVDWLNSISVGSVAGTVRLSLTFANPDGAPQIFINFAIPSTAVPSSGAMAFAASGKAPSLSFTHSGRVSVTANDVKLQLAGTHVDGTPADLSAISCGLDPGQDDTVAVFDVAGTQA